MVYIPKLSSVGQAILQLNLDMGKGWMSTIEEDEIRKHYMKGNLRVILIEMLSSRVV